MLRHIVMFNWKPEVTEEQINAVAKGFAHLAEVIDVVIEMKFGKNLAPYLVLKLKNFSRMSRFW